MRSKCSAYDCFNEVDLIVSSSPLSRSNLRQQHKGLKGKSDLVFVTADAFRREALLVTSY